MRASRTRWCSPSSTSARSGGSTAFSRTQTSVSGPARLERAVLGPRPNCVLWSATIALETATMLCSWICGTRHDYPAPGASARDRRSEPTSKPGGSADAGPAEDLDDRRRPVERLPHAVVHVEVEVVRQAPREEQPVGADEVAQVLLVAVVERPVALRLDRVVARRRARELEAEDRPLAHLAGGMLRLVHADERELRAGVV